MPHSLGLDIGGTSTKLVVVTPDGEQLTQLQSDAYSRPDLDKLSRVVAALILQAECTDITNSPIGLCLPGQFEPDGMTVRYSANLPALASLHVPTFLISILGIKPKHIEIIPDAQAAAIGSWHHSPNTGRMLAISMGTGVGSSLLANGRPVVLAPGTSGHLGQIDVSLNDEASIGPDGGRGSLESYVGLPALYARFGENLEDALANLGQQDPVLLALARAMRIAHAIYTPDEIRLLGGVGIALTPKLAALKSIVDRDLTAVARSDWALTSEDSVYLAAFGAAIEATTTANTTG